MSETSIADMPLYTNLDRIARGLSTRGIGAKIRSRQSSYLASTNGTITGSARSALRPDAGRSSQPSERPVLDQHFAIRSTQVR